ncbi:hypothetical protein RclHR1_08190001 [Rhizophagus clarus]|uniref:Uncharacterized protein n=1 Tax=Rhizophagus clarus TaxID=94130 RepID=A0A2Z6SB91_9GLOM|nr:hypothetical protein RclHR1_08190001 [Rhizophagus clarus]GES81547.1 hypothetical protein GLOIN_2v1532168 [Rhizophagus clarus]
MSHTGIIIANITVLVALGILALSFAGVNVAKLPPQANGTYTGLPVWHPPIQNSDDNIHMATVSFGSILMIIAGVFALKWANADPKANGKSVTYFRRDGNKYPTIEFDRYLAGYCLITALTGIVYVPIDVGKIWSTTGILHNASEVLIMITLHQGGRISSLSVLAWLLLYVLFAEALSIYLKWPFDALWFKVQGLCSDYALVIQFTRMYFNTLKEYKHGHENHQSLRRDNTSVENALAETIDLEPALEPFRPIYNYNYILILVIASALHIFGNILTTIWIYSFRSYTAFSFTYCITYPLYAYFIYLDTHTYAIPPAQKYIMLPDPSKLKVILVTLSSIFLAIFTARIGAIVQS